MSNENGITVDNLLRTLPDALRNDENMKALGQAIADKLATRPSEIASLSIYARIDELPEALLDILAYDFKVDWWDPNFTLAEKRQTLKSSWNVRRRLGTPYAVEKALSAIYPDSQVKEWFEYAGAPYHFKLLIPVDQSILDPTKHAKVLSLVAFYKNLRSVLDEVEYFGTNGIAMMYATAAFVGCEGVFSATAYD